MSTETNCFKIEGLEQLTYSCKLYRIAGLRPDSAEFYSNVQRLVRQLSFQLKAPVTTIERAGETLLVIPDGFATPPDHMTLVGAVAAIRDTTERLDLSFVSNSSELDNVRIRLLQFAFQGRLWNDSQLWQSAAGRPFFFKKPARSLGNLDIYEGFSLRVMVHPEGGFGIVVDLHRKLISRSPLSPKIDRGEVNSLKGRSCLYKMGGNWYEVSLSGLSDLKIGEPSILINGKAVSLIDYLHSVTAKPVPGSIAQLSPEGAAIYYRTNGPDQRLAPAELCYLLEDTHTSAGARHQQETVISPEERHRHINSIVKRFLNRFRLSDVELTISTRAGRANTKAFELPSLKFGNGKILAFSKGQGGYFDAMRSYGRQRLSLLDDATAGFFERSPLGRHYVVMPKSIANSSGQQFLDDLKAQVTSLYPSATYAPELLVYDDLNCSRDFGSQSRSIKSALESARVQPGFAVVMIHRYKRRVRSADQLAAWVVREFPRLFQLTASVIHTEVVQRSYISKSRDGETRYIVKDIEAKRLGGYTRIVAINKVLLTNGKWPFVLDSSLHADVIIGIDVKNSTAAFTLIGDGGAIIRSATSASRQKEQLLRPQVAQYVSDLIRREHKYLASAPKQIVIHRDGRAWPSEIDGVKDACEALAREGFIDSSWQLTVLEIFKSSAASLRLFAVKPARDGRQSTVDNPVVGSWLNIGNGEGYICTTGSPFRIPGTANPLHVRRAFGSMPIGSCLEDVFALSCLTWSRPEGVMRLPISIKLCDRNLAEEAADFDADEIQFGNDNDPAVSNERS